MFSVFCVWMYCVFVIFGLVDSLYVLLSGDWMFVFSWILLSVGVYVTFGFFCRL